MTDAVTVQRPDFLLRFTGRGKWHIGYRFNGRLGTYCGTTSAHVPLVSDSQEADASDVCKRCVASKAREQERGRDGAQAQS